MLSSPLKYTARIMLASAAMLLSIDGAFSETAKSKNDTYARAVPFQSADRLDGYNVSGLWFPEDNVPFAGLSGPAIFVFKNASSGKQWTVAVNAIALLDKDFWDNHQVADAAQFEPKVLLEKLGNLGIEAIPVSLSKDKRGRNINCERSADATASGKARVEQCLELGDAVVDLQDIDFDGKKELVFRHAGIGQRSGAAYEVVRVPGEDGYAAGDPRDPFSREPFHDIDWRTAINITRKQIVIKGSNGACDSTAAAYSRDAHDKMIMTHFWRTVMQLPDDCHAEDYSVENPMDGLGRRLKLLSRKKPE